MTIIYTVYIYRLIVKKILSLIYNALYHLVIFKERDYFLGCNLIDLFVPWNRASASILDIDLVVTTFAMENGS